MGNKNAKPNFKELSTGLNLSTAEVKAWFDMFQKDFPKGNINREEFEVLYTKMIGAEGDAKDFCNHVFRQYDMDGNGTIDFREFVTTVSVATKGCLTEKLLWAFSLYDLDDNHYLSRQEITQVLTALYKAKGKPKNEKEVENMVDVIFRSADDNADGVLSEAEFVKHAASCDAVQQMVMHL